jgi:proteasome lid subunit RPN8/RPN11
MKVSDGVIEHVVRHTREAVPEECCGILLGTGDRIEDARRGRNSSDQPTVRFVLDPRDHVAAIREARGRGLTVVGFYHSHPRSAAVPSETDRAEASYPGQLVLIVGLAGEPADVRLYRFADGNFLEVPFVTVA